MISSGTYFLLINVAILCKIKIKSLGEVEFQPGYYTYIGSALSSRKIVNSPKKKGVLINRVLRHTKPITQKKKHWHIDYLLAAEEVEIVRIYLIPGKTKFECDLRNILFNFALGEIRKFGASDCLCASHLLYFGKKFFL